MRITTVCFLLRRKQVLLAPRKDSVGFGNWSGYGGKVDGSESVTDALVREIQEESGLVVLARDLTKVALINRFFCGVQVFKISVFTARRWTGIPQETAEMGEPRWFAFNKLPLREMWEGDRMWLPRVLASETFEAEVRIDEEGELERGVVYRHKVFAKEPA